MTGTRWLSRWDKEIGLFVKLLYYGLTVGRGMWSTSLHDEWVSHIARAATQTLGEEYTGVWLRSIHLDRAPSRGLRAAMILLPTLPSYLLSKWGSSVPPTSKLGAVLSRLPVILEVFTEINLAMFYLHGTYYHLVRRLLGIRYVRPH